MDDVTASSHGRSPALRALEVEHQIEKNPYEDLVASFFVVLPSGDVLDLGYMEQGVYDSDEEFERSIAVRKKRIAEKLSQVTNHRVSLNQPRGLSAVEEPCSEDVNT